MSLRVAVLRQRIAGRQTHRKLGHVEELEESLAVFTGRTLGIAGVAQGHAGSEVALELIDDADQAGVAIVETIAEDRALVPESCRVPGEIAALRGLGKPEAVEGRHALRAFVRTVLFPK